MEFIRNKIDSFFETRFGSKVAALLGIALLLFFIWLFFVPNSICDGPCIKDFDFGGRGGNPQESYQEDYYDY